MLEAALTEYARFLRREVGYPEGETVLMLTGFAVGWKMKEALEPRAVDEA